MNILKNIGKLSILFAVIGLIATSCSDKKQLQNKLEGSWNAKSVDGSDDGSNKTQGTSVKISANQAGEYHFDDDGTGSYQLSVHIEVTQSNGNVSFSNTVTTSGEFDWENDDNSVTLNYTAGPNQGKQVKLDIEEETDNEIKVSGNGGLDLFVSNSTSISNDVLDLNVSFNMHLVKQ
jgi:hypothetical protein